MAALFLIICLTVVVASGRKIHNIPESLYHYNHASNPDSNTVWNFAPHLTINEDALPAVDVVPSRPDLNNEDNEDTVWEFAPLENSNKDYLYEYVGDNWMLGEEDSPYSYYTEGKGEQKDKEEIPAKHRRKHRRLRSPNNKHKTENALHNSFDALREVRSARKTPRFAPNKMKRAIRLHSSNFLTTPDKVHPTDLQFVPAVRKRDAQLQKSDLAVPAGRFQMYRLSKRNAKRRKRQVKAHQLEYFTDNDGASQFHAPGKTEGTEWDLVPLEALKDDNEEELGIQYDKKANDASLLTTE